MSFPKRYSWICVWALVWASFGQTDVTSNAGDDSRLPDPRPNVLSSAASDSDGGRAHSRFQFVDLESGGPIRPRSVRIDGLEVADFVGSDGILEADLVPGEHAVEIHADGFMPMQARHGAVAPESLPNTFQLVPQIARKAARAIALADGNVHLYGWVRRAATRAPIAGAGVSFHAGEVNAITQTDWDGAYSLSVARSSFERDWLIRAEAAGCGPSELAGSGAGDLAVGFVQSFVLSGAERNREPMGARAALVLPAVSMSGELVASKGQIVPATIRVGMGAALAAAQTCSGMNAKCSSSLNACSEVDVVDTEIYVKRVLRGELFGTLIWNDAQKEGFKANAVAIRSYAAWHALSGPRGSRYDLCNGDNCQCYFSGFTAFGPTTTAASNETAGQVMLDRVDHVARTRYGSWNGPCERGIMHCDFQPIYDYAIDQNWTLRPSQSSLWGHGRGQSQYGTHFRAKNGESYEGILAFYYQDYGWHLSPQAPLLLSGPEWNGGAFRFVVNGPSGRVPVVQSSSDLIQWHALWTNSINADGTLRVTDATASLHPRQYYRAVVPEP